MAYVFGYGSLVNGATHDASLTPARLEGYRRVWHHTTLRDIAFLSIHEVPGAVIEGAVQAVPNADFAALDRREAGYRRLSAKVYPTTDPCVVYQVPPENRVDGAPHALLLSYIDVVVAGFLEHFGVTGVTRFFETTDGWNVRVIDDRQTPRYPRHQPLHAQVKALTDANLDNLPVTMVQAE